MQKKESYNINHQRKAFSWSYLILFMTFYAIIPILFGQQSLKDASYVLAFITFISSIGYLLGLNINTSRRIIIPKIALDFNRFAMTIYILYIIVIGVIFITADNIPLLESLGGASQEDLITFRETFLKKREGWQSMLSYIVTLIDSAIFPYIIVYAFNVKNEYRYLYLITFLLYSLSFLEKGYFFKIALPVFFFFYYKTKNKKSFLIKGAVIFGIFITGMFAASRFETNEYVRDDPFFTILYTPQDISSAIAWRIIAVPVITAIEGIDLFFKGFNGEFLYGGTSSFISFFSGLERVNFERSLYQTQFGGAETGNANQCYLVEAFINFGYIGIIFFSFFIGKLIKGIINTRDIAALCIMPLFLYNLFSTGLIGNLLSNGFILFFLFFRFIKFNRQLT